MSKNRFLCAAALLFSFGCVSQPRIPFGLQPEFKAINPSRVLAVPPFVLPDPGHAASVDAAALELGQVLKIVETEVLKAFKGQPSVNGVSFSSVRATLAADPKPIYTTLDTILKSTSAKLISTDATIRNSLSKNCLGRKNFVDYYGLCVVGDKPWTENLNALSARVLNADSALLIAVTHLDKKLSHAQYKIEAEIAAILVDTNSGKVIWAREIRDESTNSPDKLSFPEWQPLFEKIINEKFWLEFPGRVSRDSTKN